jgi:type IV pilus assembly protein PilE
MRQAVRGFSLIELMIAVVIVGILAAIALPSYNNYVLRANRTVGKAMIMEIAAKQESYFTDRKRYAADLAQLGYVAAFPVLTADSRLVASSSAAIYSVSIMDVDAAGSYFLITIIPQGRQVKDTKCGTMSLNSRGVKAASGSDGASNCWRS